MSIDFRPLREIHFIELFDGRLNEHDVYEKLGVEGITEHCRCLTDGSNCLWAYCDEHGMTSFTLYCVRRNTSRHILWAISEAFDTQVVSEYEPEFWGFDTQEEWDAAWEELAKKGQEEFYCDLVKHLRGEATDIGPGTIGMIRARIAEGLVTERPELMLPSNKEGLLRAIEVIYERDRRASMPAIIRARLDEIRRFQNDEPPLG
jgi:hypothetical protein